MSIVIITKIISNLHKISHFLAPSLPTFKETQDYLRTIHLSIDDNGNNDNAHGLDDSAHGHDDDNGQDDSRVRRPSARLLGSAPASENLETAPERRPSVRPIRFTRPKKSPPPIDRAHKYSLRKNPTSNIQHPTSNIQHHTFNIQHPTSNI